jgi:endonuclease YncB( thermonuclease family)
VLKIIDGDTIKVRINNNQIKIRLACIDAPEMSQAWGIEAKEFLM